MDSTASASPAASKAHRGKDQVPWSEAVWESLDHAVKEELTRTASGRKFLPLVHVDRKITNIAQDVVINPATPILAAAEAVGGAPAPIADPALSVDESATFRVQEYWTTFKLSVAQVHAEEHHETATPPHSAPTHAADASHSSHAGAAAMVPHHRHRASTAVSLALRTANILAQAEDLLIFNGANAVVNNPLFIAGVVQVLDSNLAANIDLGLLNIKPILKNGQIPPKPAPGAQPTPPDFNQIQLPWNQVILVHPTTESTPGAIPPRYAEQTLNAVASAFSMLQANGHYEYYALALHTIPYADLHQALASTLIEPVEPISHLVTAGVLGSGTLPPFTSYPPIPPAAIPTPPPVSTGLPTSYIDPNGNNAPLPIKSFDGTKTANVLYTGVLVSLSGNTMDLVRGKMDGEKDVVVNFNQKDQNEAYRFRVVHRHCLRVKDPTAIALLLFLDS